MAPSNNAWRRAINLHWDLGVDVEATGRAYMQSRPSSRTTSMPSVDWVGFNEA